MENFALNIRIVLTTICFCLSQCSDSQQELSGDYSYFDEGVADKFIISEVSASKAIYGKVIDYKFNDQFIVAIQRPDFNAHKSKIAFELRNDIRNYPDNSVEDIQVTEVRADSILTHNPYYKKVFSRDTNYWIIMVKSDSLVGPLSFEDYLIIKERLEVPESMNVKQFLGHFF